MEEHGYLHRRLFQGGKCCLHLEQSGDGAVFREDLSTSWRQWHFPQAFAAGVRSEPVETGLREGENSPVWRQHDLERGGWWALGMGVLLCLESKGCRDTRDAAPGVVLCPRVCTACVVRVLTVRPSHIPVPQPGHTSEWAQGQKEGLSGHSVKTVSA